MAETPELSREDKLRLAIQTAGYGSVRAFAKAWAGPESTPGQRANRERQLRRYLSGSTWMSRTTAVELATLLNQPPDYFYEPEPASFSLWRSMERLARDLAREENSAAAAVVGQETVAAMRQLAETTARMADRLEKALEDLPSSSSG